MIPKIYKRIAILVVLFCLIIVPFLFWLSGWNFERNATGIGCVITTLIACALGGGITMAIGSDNRE